MGTEQQTEKPAGEQEVIKPYQDKEIAFNPDLPWRSNANELLALALDPRYKDRLNTVLKGINERKVDELFNEIAFLELKNGILLFKDTDKKLLYSVDLTEGLHEARTDMYHKDCEICKRRSQKLRIYRFRNMSYGDALEEIMKERNLAEGRRTRIPVRKIPLTKEEAEANRRTKEYLNAEIDKRNDLLQEAETHEDFGIQVDIDPNLKDNNIKELQQNWLYMSGSHAIDELFRENPDSQKGYAVNPFKEQGWNSSKLLEAIQGGGFWNRNDRLYFEDVAEEIYSKRFGDFKKILKTNGIKDEMMPLLEDKNNIGKISLITLFDGTELADIQVSYRKLKKVAAELKDIKDPKKAPEQYRKIYPFRKQLDTVIQILGDYIVYSAKLVNFVGELKYEKVSAVENWDELLTKFDPGLSMPADKVKKALNELFIKDVKSPTEYTSELSHLFTSEEEERIITFQDLNGQTATVQKEWFTEQQSQNETYKSALKEIGKPVQDKATNKWSLEISENDAKDHINNLLQLGISAYRAMPEKRTIKEIIDSLTKVGTEVAPGVPLRYGKGARADSINLYNALKIGNLDDLYKKDTDKNKLISAERTKFVRLGAIIWKYNRMARGERIEKERQTKCLKFVFSEKIAEEIIATMRKTNKFNEGQLAKFKSVLVGGGVLVLPKEGGAIDIHYEFDNGTFIDFTGAFPGWDAFAGGATVGQKFELQEDLTVSIGVTGGYSGADKERGGGWMVGGGGQITKKFKPVDWHVEAGYGYLFGPAIPTPFVGTGINWAKSQERYEETLTKKQVEHRIDELDKSKDPYSAIRANPDKYPEFKNLLYSIDNAGLKLDEPSKREMFSNAYEMFKQNIRSEAISDSTRGFLSPVGVSIGVVEVGPVTVPYLALECELWSRNLVYRVATDVEKAQNVAENQARDAILARYKTNAKFCRKTLAVSGELLLNPQNGQFMLKSVNGAGIDFSRIYSQFSQFKNELSEKAEIFVEQAHIDGSSKGLLRLKPQETYGVTHVLVDPALKDDVIVVTQSNELYISVKKDKKIFIRREDVSFPFEERGGYETSTIVITDNPHVQTEVIKADAPYFLEQLPGHDWKLRPRYTGATLEERKTKEQIQKTNFKTLDEYTAWWGSDGHPDRLESINVKGLQASYEKLRQAITLSEEQLAHESIRPQVRERIAKLTKDDKFIRRFRELSTRCFDFSGKKKYEAAGAKSFQELWGNKYYQELIKELNTRLSHEGKLGFLELNAALYALLVASFQNIHDDTKETPQEQYKRFLESFERPMLTSILNDYYKKDDPEKDKKVKEAVNWIIKEMEDADVTAQGSPTEAGTLFATLVGLPGPRDLTDPKKETKIKGIRPMYNFAEEKDPQWGIVDKTPLNVKTKGTAGEVARFWVETLSPFVRGLHKKDTEILLADPTNTESQKYQREVNDALNSYLALQLMPLFAVTLSQNEMDQLAKIYEGGRVTAAITINRNNIGVVKKFLEFCEKVRDLELTKGKSAIPLEGTHLKLIINPKVWLGIYKKCGNISGLFAEKFALVDEGAKQIYFAGMSEAWIGVKPGYGRNDVSVILGVALPLVAEKRVSPPREEIPPEKHKRPPGNGGPPTRPPREPTPPTGARAQPEPAAEGGVAQGEGGTTGGTIATPEGTAEEGGAGI